MLCSVMGILLPERYWQIIKAQGLRSSSFVTTVWHSTLLLLPRGKKSTTEFDSRNILIYLLVSYGNKCIVLILYYASLSDLPVLWEQLWIPAMYQKARRLWLKGANEKYKMMLLYISCARMAKQSRCPHIDSPFAKSCWHLEVLLGYQRIVAYP